MGKFGGSELICFVELEKLKKPVNKTMQNNWLNISELFGYCDGDWMV